MIAFLTSNKGKFEEAAEILGRKGIRIERIESEYEEVQSGNLEEVVMHALEGLDLKEVFIEDAGFFVDALSGFPGVYSSYVYETLGNPGILKLLEGCKDRRAGFCSIIGYKGPGGEVRVFRGEIRGTVATAIRGSEGFGYDPIFIPEGHTKTFAEDMKVKNRISHRKAALEALADYLEKERDHAKKDR